MKNLFSKFLTTNLRDWIKGLLMALIGAAIGIIYPSIEAGNFQLDWEAIWKASTIAGVGYLFKNWLTNSKDEFMQKEQKHT